MEANEGVEITTPPGTGIRRSITVVSEQPAHRKHTGAVTERSHGAVGSGGYPVTETATDDTHKKRSTTTRTGLPW
jgi:hypothetical protein